MMKLKHMRVILSVLTAVFLLIAAIPNIVTERYLVAAINCAIAVFYSGLAFYWASRGE